MTAAEFLERLDGVHGRGTGRWFARCPSHEDKSPSLSIREGDGGKIVVYCFAGCSARAICEAIGLELKDLFSDREASRRHDLQPRRANWRRQASELLHDAEAIAYRAELTLSAATGLSIADWTEEELDAAVNAVAGVYQDIERAALFRDCAFTLRARGLAGEQQERNGRHAG